MPLKGGISANIELFQVLSDKNMLKYWNLQTQVQGQKYIKMTDFAPLRVQ